MIQIYLAGAVFEEEYRKTCKKIYNGRPDIKLIDPLEEIEVNATNHNEVVEMDKIAIENCDIVIAYINKYTCGTVMEILHAWNHQVPVYTILPNGWEAVSSHGASDVWLKYHTTTFFDSIDNCFNHIHTSIDG